LSDLFENIYLGNWPFTILVWSGAIMLASAAGFYVLYEQTKADLAHEKTDADRELEEAGISTVPGFILALPFLFLIALALGAAFVISAVASGVVLTHYAALGALHIIETGSPYVAILFISVALLLYGMRTRYPFIYGVVEVIVGISAIIAVLPNQPATNTLVVYAELLSVSGGMYVIVRGLDNMNKAVPERIRAFWFILRWGVPLEKK
jgi:hypothetical protein